MFKKICKSAFLICLVLIYPLIFSSCMEINFNVEKVMKPPIVSDDQRGIQEALVRFTDNQELKLIYPKSGEYIMPFIRQSTEDRDKNTVFAFYSITNENKTATKIAMLKKNLDVWNVISSVEVSNRYNCEIEDVSFHRMCKSDNDTIIVGTGIQGRGQKEVLAYEYSDTKLRAIVDINHSCTAKILTDIDDDGFDELILIDRSANTEPSIMIEKLKKTPSLEYKVKVNYTLLKENPNVVKDANLTVGKLKNNNKAIFIDEIVYDENQEKEFVATELVEVEYVSNDGLVNRTFKEAQNFGEPDFDLMYLTQRGKNVELSDIDNDGSLEIPYERPITEFSSSGEENLKEIDWYSFYGDNVKLSAIEIMDVWAKYRLKLKLDWFEVKKEKLKNTDIERESGELKVQGNYKPKNHELTLKNGSEKIVICVAPKGEKVKNIFSKFATSGGLDYYVSIPNKSEEEQEIAMREFRELFKILN